MSIQTDNDQFIQLHSPDQHSSCTIYYHGAHITSYINNGKELLFLSKKSSFEQDKAIRGGIPICFPQFANVGKLKISHGIARNVNWKLIDKKLTLEKVTVIFELIKSNEYNGNNLEIKNYLSELDNIKVHFIVTLLNDQLINELYVKNDRYNNNDYNNLKEEKIFTFTFAFHNYFKINDISNVKIIGNLHGINYIDKTRENKTFNENNKNSLTISEEVDRIYLNLKDNHKFSIQDINQDINNQDINQEINKDINNQDKENNSVIISIEKDNKIKNIIVWNPWIEKAKKMNDLREEDYKKFVCLEVGQVEEAIQLLPGEEYSGKQIISKL